jgi:anti-sigma factor (TIGR02949 family)
MNNLSFDSKRCERIRQQLDSYLSNELLVETASEVMRHLESCGSCSRDLEFRMRLRDALQRAVANRPSPDSLRAGVLRRLRESQPRSFARVGVKRWALGFASVAVVLLSLFAAQWFNLRRGEQLIASILKLGVSDHLICAIKGHNYPVVANPPDEIRNKLGVRYAVLLQVVQERLPGFEVLEGHICSIPGSNRKYIHFITRGEGTILSVILTERNGASLPKGQLPASPESAGLSVYEGHLSGMEIAGFESAQYFAFVVSDLSQNQVLQLARGLAPALNETLQSTAFQGLNFHVLNALFKLRHVITTSVATISRPAARFHRLNEATG